MAERKLIFIASEEGGFGNKLGGIWNVVHNEAWEINKIIEKRGLDYRIFVIGPLFKGFDDWSHRARVTDIDLEEITVPQEVEKRIVFLQEHGTDVIVGRKRGIDFILLGTSRYDTVTVDFEEASGMRLSDYIKYEAYKLTGLESDKYEKEFYGKEYTHYLNFSWAVSQLGLVGRSLHVHEFPVFYAAARVELLNKPVKTVATFHATKWGRGWGRKAIEMIKKNDPTLPPHAPIGLIELEKLARYADIVTFVGSMTRREAEVAYGISGHVIRNGIRAERDYIDWKKKAEMSKRIKEWITKGMARHMGVELDPEYLLVWFTISRAEVYNKGYDVLADALRIRDVYIREQIESGVLPEKFAEAFIIITSMVKKPPEVMARGFPFVMEKELLVDQELVLVNEILEPRKLTIEEFARGRRRVLVIPYLTWIHEKDGGLNMNPDQVAAGTVGGVFPSYYEPFLLTSLETGREATPAAVSEVCGIRDAIEEYLRKTGRVGGVFIIRNLHRPPMECSAAISFFMDMVDKAYLFDRQKYKMMCAEHFELAKKLNWKEPAEKYFKALTL